MFEVPYMSSLPTSDKFSLLTSESCHRLVCYLLGFSQERNHRPHRHDIHQEGLPESITPGGSAY